jgi:hypothetical protein
VPFLLFGPPFFSNYSFLVHHPVNLVDWHLLAHAMAFDFTVAWQFSQREQLVFLLLHAPKNMVKKGKRLKNYIT